MPVAYTMLLYFAALISIRGFIVIHSIFCVRKKIPGVLHVQKSKQLLHSQASKPMDEKYRTILFLVMVQPLPSR